MKSEESPYPHCLELLIIAHVLEPQALTNEVDGNDCGARGFRNKLFHLLGRHGTLGLEQLDFALQSLVFTLGLVTVGYK